MELTTKFVAGIFYSHFENAIRMIGDIYDKR
jgi:hypothetical protein